MMSERAPAVDHATICCWACLHRAVVKAGETIDFYLSPP